MTKYDLETARQLLRLSEKKVSEQRRVVEELKAQGKPALMAKELLCFYESNCRSHSATYQFLMSRRLPSLHALYAGGRPEARETSEGKTAKS
jgi:hypothetical protein